MIAGSVTSWSWLPPSFWPLLLFAPPVLFWLYWRARRQRLLRRQWLPRRDARSRAAAWSSRCAVLSLLALLLALLRPVAGLEAALVRGPDVVFCLDVSWSMAAQDVAPSRFARALQSIAALAAEARDARFALVVFAGEAKLMVPLTGDVTAVALRAQHLAPGAELRGGTDLGAAIGVAAEALRAGGAGAGVGTGSIVLLTDGEDFAVTAERAAAKARETGFVVHCLGFGSEVGSKIVVETEAGQAFLRSASGDEIVTALDVTALRAVTEAGAGGYRDGGEPQALAQLYRREILPQAMQAQLAAGQVAAHRYQWPLLAALLLWMLRLLMSGLEERSR